MRSKLTVPRVLLALPLAPPSSVNVPRKFSNAVLGGTVSTNRSPVKLVPGARDSGKSFKKSLSSSVIGGDVEAVSVQKHRGAVADRGRHGSIERQAASCVHNISSRIGQGESYGVGVRCRYSQCHLSFIISSILFFVGYGY